MNPVAGVIAMLGAAVGGPNSTWSNCTEPLNSMRFSSSSIAHALAWRDRVRDRRSIVSPFRTGCLTLDEEHPRE